MGQGPDVTEALNPRTRMLLEAPIAPTLLRLAAPNVLVMLSQDGVPVLIHDETLDRCAISSGRVAGISAERLMATDVGVRFHPAFAGETIPSLAAALQRCRQLGLAANLEIKPAAGFEVETGRVVGRLLGSLRSDERPALLLSSFSDRALEAAALEAAELPRGWLPGGFIDAQETLWQSCLRELAEETHWPLDAAQMRAALRGVALFDHPGRSQRGRVISQVHYFELGGAPVPVQGGDDASSAQWLPISQLAALQEQFHDDHFHILDHFLGLQA